MSLVLLLAFASALIHIGALYWRMGSMAPVYMVFRAPCPSPQFSLADFDKAKIDLEHLSVI
jgi:hypothetical protein